MLSTDELRKYVFDEIQIRLGNFTCENVFFMEGSENNNEGTYIFNRDNEYHICFVEKGNIREEIVTQELKEVLWNVVEVISFNPIMEFAKCNRVKGKDFRRAFFAKEKEIFSLFGKDFQERKDKEIEEILKKNPYNDI